ncbi:hypothetical protein TWF106_007342, partial [Orbilia oligospora]
MAPPILLLKTKSTPTDPYATLLSSNGYNPIFVPVLHHTAINAWTSNCIVIIASPTAQI